MGIENTNMPLGMKDQYDRALRKVSRTQVSNREWWLKTNNASIKETHLHRQLTLDCQTLSKQSSSTNKQLLSTSVFVNLLLTPTSHTIYNFIHHHELLQPRNTRCRCRLLNASGYSTFTALIDFETNIVKLSSCGTTV
jgi:hypothetical protein